MQIPAWILKAILGEAGALLQSIIGALVQRRVMDHVVTLARAEVDKLMGNDGLDGAAKRKIAAQAVTADLQAAGMIVGQSIINLGVELAVSAAKATAPKAGLAHG